MRKTFGAYFIFGHYEAWQTQRMMMKGVEFRVPCLIADIVINMLIEKDGFEKSLIIDPKEKRVFNNIPNLCFELREIENAKLRTLFCQKVQDLDRALFCEMVNTREGAERKTRIELLLLKTTSLSSGRGILAKSTTINLATGHKNQLQLPKMKFEKQCR